MGDRSRIEWTEATWNPITGCSKVSPGCANCYAERVSQRYGWTTLPWTAANAGQNIRLHSERLDQPLRWRRPRLIFVNSMSDLFHEQVPNNFLESVWRVMLSASRHVFQVLTKRPERMAQIVPAMYNRIYGPHWEPMPNVWLGVSVEDQRNADERIPLLLRTPAAVRLVSIEPMLGPVDLRRWVDRRHACECGGLCDPGEPCPMRDNARLLDWVIVGAQTGPGASLPK